MAIKGWGAIYQFINIVQPREDRQLQAIVDKVVPGLEFQEEQRRKTFYEKHHEEEEEEDDNGRKSRS